MRNFLKSEDGFSLLEVVLSVAVIAIFTGYALQMFVVSANVNGRAKNMDTAASLARNALETLKAQDALDGAVLSGIFSDGFIDDSGGVEEVYYCYDKNWNKLPLESAEPLPDGAAFLQKTLIQDGGVSGDPVYMDITGSSRDMTPGSGELYKISSAVYAVGSSGALTELAGFATEKYVPMW
ncbi:MAG: type II secretion system GspH family protein [Defluviitaleaceae bacterium]|nr:type II secretion system GspH family protein [Defluviitaleaceae bacterium]